MEAQGHGAGKNQGEGGLVIFGLEPFPHQVMVAAGLAMVLSLGLGLAYLALSMITQGKPLIWGVNITKFQSPILKPDYAMYFWVFLVHPETTLPDGLETSGRRAYC